MTCEQMRRRRRVEIWMEQLMAFLQKHWQFTIIGCGLLIFIRRAF